MTFCTSMTIFSVQVDKQSQFLYLISNMNCYLPVELEYFCSTSCCKKLTPSPPLLIITQMPLLNSLLNSLLKYHYSNHYSPLLKCHFHYSSLLRHYSKGTLLMLLRGRSGFEPCLGQASGHVTTWSTSPRLQRSLMLTFATKKLLTGANGQKEEAGFPFCPRILIELLWVFMLYTILV